MDSRIRSRKEERERVWGFFNRMSTICNQTTTSALLGKFPD